MKEQHLRTCFTGQVYQFLSQFQPDTASEVQARERMHLSKAKTALLVHTGGRSRTASIAGKAARPLGTLTHEDGTLVRRQPGETSVGIIDFCILTATFD